MTNQEETVAREMLPSANDLLERSSADARGLWPRRGAASAAGTRGCAEDVLQPQGPRNGGVFCSCAAVCLGTYLGNEEIARRADHVWTALCRAAHFHVYELPPTREELMSWRETILQVIDATEARWR